MRMTALCVVAGCSVQPDVSAPINPFRDLPPIAIDGVSRDLTETIVPMGRLEGGRVVRVLVEGDAIESVLILTEDEVFAEAGLIAGGGRAGEAFDYRIPADGRYFVFVQFAADTVSSQRTGTITLDSGDPDFTPPATQAVLLSFERGYLSDPGLFDTVSGTDEELALLDEISDQVRELVVGRVRTIFEGTPIVIFDEADPLPAGSFSTVTFSPARVVADEGTFAIDSAVPATTDESAECLERVVFGEVLPRGASGDFGNQVPDDEAMVYVGSFQGRGEACRTAAINSVNNIVLGLSQTAAHEIGHLLGLHHVALVDLMDRSPSRAFQRELDFARGQILTEQEVRGADGSVTVATTVRTTIIQDPLFYFESIFSD